MYSFSNKDRDEIIEFLSDFREIARDLPRHGLRWENKKLRAKLLLKKIERKQPQ